MAKTPQVGEQAKMCCFVQDQQRQLARAEAALRDLSPNGTFEYTFTKLLVVARAPVA